MLRLFPLLRVGLCRLRRLPSGGKIKSKKEARRLKDAGLPFYNGGEYHSSKSRSRWLRFKA